MIVLLPPGLHGLCMHWLYYGGGGGVTSALTPMYVRARVSMHISGLMTLYHTVLHLSIGGGGFTL
jgi:cyanate permease